VLFITCSYVLENDYIFQSFVASKCRGVVQKSHLGAPAFFPSLPFPSPLLSPSIPLSFPPLPLPFLSLPSPPFGSILLRDLVRRGGKKEMREGKGEWKEKEGRGGACPTNKIICLPLRLRNFSQSACPSVTFHRIVQQQIALLVYARPIRSQLQQPCFILRPSHRRPTPG